MQNSKNNNPVQYLLEIHDPTKNLPVNIKLDQNKGSDRPLTINNIDYYEEC